MRRNPFFLLVPVLFLAACATPEQRAQRAAQDEAQRQAQAQQIVASLKVRCNAYGFREGTDGFASCMQTEVRAFEAQARARAQQRDQASAQSFRQGMCLAGNQQYCDNAPSGGYKQGTHIYIINGRQVTCTTTGTVTNCF